MLQDIGAHEFLHALTSSVQSCRSFTAAPSGSARAARFRHVQPSARIATLDEYDRELITERVNAGVGQ
ncbi:MULTISPECIES: hypothetical protein [unclassified Arthrobacter]|uniref:hypothetical protein n=1 Tax=unclassified Arthrobacter TaxID=235627 RepID=UPI000485B336|nr:MULTISPECIES: hypothetical protein [unclassified Arthrobacter]